MNFDKHSNFNPKANFSEVKFGENMPVLEVELNEMQQIQNEARADIIRDSIPSGFVTLGEIDYDYCKSNDNQIKLKTESVAYVNGYRIVIPKDTIIEIGESDKVREDLVFLEVWKEVVTDESDLKEYGGEQNAGIENPIKDERYPIATSQRVALKYRIRHVSNVDFSILSLDGMCEKNTGRYQWLDNKAYGIVAQGGNNVPPSIESLNDGYKRSSCLFRNSGVHRNNETPEFAYHIGDRGLFYAGQTLNLELSKDLTKTIDGFVYAIPMFRLKRKPNVGLASPFEYKKIHTQIDPKKFAHLVNQENVEKVHSVDVVGKTYTNLLTYASVHNNGNVNNVVISPERVSFNAPTNWGKVGFLINGQPNTKYIFHCSDFFHNGTNKWVQFYVRHQFNLSIGAGILNKVDEYTYTFDTDSTGVILFTFEIPEGVTGAYVDSPIIMKYDEWNDELRGKTIVGMQSLGQEQCNSITIENNLVKEGVYVPELQNHILPTHPEVTHVSWGEDVVIPPEVEIELKRGEELLQTITQLPVKLETTGEEKLHVKSMKGRTLVNIQHVSTPNLSVPVAGVYEVPICSPNHIKAKYLGGEYAWKYISFACPKLALLKPNTKYFVLFEKATNVTHVKLMSGNTSSSGSTQEAVTNNWSIITTNDLSNTSGLLLYVTFNDGNVVGSETEVKNPMIIEYQEGMENWGLKYFEGMKSVEAPSIKIIGKNLYYTPQEETQWGGAYIKVNQGNTVTYVPNSNNNIGMSTTCYFPTPIKASPNTVFTYSIEHLSGGNSVFTGSVNNYLLVLLKNGEVATIIPPDFTSSNFNGKITHTFTFTDNMKEIIGINPIGYSVQNLTKELTLRYQLQYGDTATIFEPHKLHTFRTPKNTVLRSIPHQNIFDSIDFNKGTINSYIDEVVFDGSSDEVWQMGANTDGESQRFDYCNLKHKLPYVDSNEMPPLLCNHLLPVNFNTIYGNRGYGVGLYYNSFIVINNGLTQLETLKAQMSQNPIIVQYKKKNPTTTLLYLSNDDYVGKSKITYQLAEPLRKVGTYSDFIKGKTLYSNIGVEVLNGSENIVQRGETLENTLLFVTHLTDLGIKSNLIYSDKFDGTDISWNEIITSDKEFIRLYTNDTNALYIRISKSKLATQDVNGFKKWLQDNPVTIYYVKANPMEIPLKEVSPLECDFSYYRQFDNKYTGYPKELPNGVKDVVIGKDTIKRYTRHLRFDGTESWNALSTDGDVVRAFVNVTTSENLKPKAISEVLNSYKLPFGTSSITREEIGVDQNSNIVLALAKSRLSSADLSGFKNYLGQNPIQVILELNSPYQNTVTEDKCKPIPYMPLNSYVGSLYVANGNNHTKLLTSFSSDVEVQTYHRFYSNEFNNFMDVTKKKSPYGHVTVPHSLSSNIHDGKFIENTGFILSTGLYESASQWIASVNKFPVKKGVTYHVKVTANDEAITENKRYTYVYKYDLNGNYLTQRIDVGTRTSFTSDFDGYALLVMKTMNVSHIQVTPNVAVEEEVKYRPTELIVQGIEKHEIEDLRHKVSLTGFDYNHLLQDSFLKLIKGELS